MQRIQEKLLSLEGAAAESAKAAASIGAASKELTAAARSADLAAIGRAFERLTAGLETLRRNIDATRNVWSVSEADEEQYLSGPYIDELLGALMNAGIDAKRMDLSITAFP